MQRKVMPNKKTTPVTGNRAYIAWSWTIDKDNKLWVRPFDGGKTKRPNCLGSIRAITQSKKGGARQTDPVIYGHVKFTCRDVDYELRQENGAPAGKHFHPLVACKGMNAFVASYIQGAPLSTIAGTRLFKY
jgi:hypothetical protein